MRIIQAGSYPLNNNCIQGGVESSVHGIAMELSRTQEVRVIDFPRYEITKDSIEKLIKFDVYRFRNFSKSPHAGVLRIFNMFGQIKSFKPDVCHLHTSSTISLLLYLLLKLYKIPVVVTIHGLAHIEKKNNWKKKRTFRNFIKYIFHSLSEFLLISISGKILVDTDYVSNEIHEYTKQYKIIHLPECLVIPQGINSCFFDFRCDLTSNTILSVGSINKRKGHIQLIESMVDIVKNCSKIKLNIAGVVSDLEYLKLMELKIIECNLSDHITIYTNLYFDDLVELYKKSSIFVLHTEEESQGIVFCEAMACGMPIVSTNRGGVPYVVTDKKGGYLSAYGDILSFSINILKVFNNYDQREIFSKYNVKMSAKYNWDLIVEETLAIYKSLLNES